MDQPYFFPRLIKTQKQLQRSVEERTTNEKSNLKISIITDTSFTNQDSFCHQFPSLIRDYFKHKPDLKKIIDDYNVINENMGQLIRTVKLYKVQTGISLEKVYSLIFKIIERLLEQHIKMMNQKKKETEALVSEHSKEMQEIKDKYSTFDGKIEQYQKLIKFYEAEYKIFKQENLDLNNEISNQNLLIQNEIGQMIKKFSNFEVHKNDSHDQIDPSDTLLYSTKNLTQVIKQFEDQSLLTDQSLNCMNRRVKAMLKGQMIDRSTQVEEGELYIQLSQPVYIDLEDDIKLSFCLTPCLAQFLPNLPMGRVIPWNSFYQQIIKLYEQRLQYNEKDDFPMDQFLCVHLLKQHKIKSVTQTHLLDFISSLKYHMKNQLAAQLLAKIIGISPFWDKQTQENDLVYKLNPDLIRFFFHCYEILSQNEKIINYKYLMPFANDIQINKFRSKVEKTDPYDVNVALNFALQEYFEAKRNLIKRLTKYFHKELEGMILDSDEFNYVIDVAGQSLNTSSKYIFTLYDELELVFNCYWTQIFRKLHQQDFSRFALRLDQIAHFNCIERNLKEHYLTQLFHQFQFILKSSIGVRDRSSSNTSQQKRPSIIEQRKKSVVKRRVSTKKEDSSQNESDLPQKSFVDKASSQKQLKTVIKITQDEQLKLANQRIKLLSQHYAIIRELKQQCEVYKEKLLQSEKVEIIWNQFKNIMKVLDSACTFLNLPIIENN